MAEAKSVKAELKKPKGPAGKRAKVKDKEEAEHGTLREYYVTTAVMTIFALFLTTYVVHPMTVPTPSMDPTILVGDRLLIDKFTVRNGFVDPLPLTASHRIKRGDVIVFKFPRDPETLYVKRAIGLPGDTIEVRNTQVYINGQPVDEPYKTHQRTHRSFPMDGDNMPPTKVEEGHYFMMGDNRDNSQDSRFIGQIPEGHIVGRPLIVFWSYADDDDAHLKSTVPELIELYAKRVIFFIPRTRWSRTGHVVR